MQLFQRNKFEQFGFTGDVGETFVDAAGDTQEVNFWDFGSTFVKNSTRGFDDFKKSFKMEEEDEREFKLARKKLVDSIRKSQTAIAAYTEEDVELYDVRMGVTDDRLKTIRKKLEIATAAT